MLLTYNSKLNTKQYDSMLVRILVSVLLLYIYDKYLCHKEE